MSGHRRRSNIWTNSVYLPEKMQALCLKRVPTQRIIEKVMQRKFDPEFLNRIDRSLHYQAVQHDALPRLVEIELDKLNKRLQHQQRSVHLSASAKAYFYQDHDIRYGADIWAARCVPNWSRFWRCIF